jgi:protein-S-isoprenylcysteine O-methyltransferase Ste14
MIDAMALRYYEFDGLGFFIIATYMAQILQVGLYPVPSAGSTFEMLFKRTASTAQSRQCLLNLETLSIGQKVILAVATLALIIVSLVPIVVILLPPVSGYLWPFFESPPKILGGISALFLVIGNFLTGLAVVTLKNNVTFHEFGETQKLVTSGIFSVIRNPITLGLGFIYGGFFLALPSVVMLAGVVLFFFNSNRRIKMEEHYLQRSFGDPYLQYQKRVGKYWPKMKRR